MRFYRVFREIAGEILYWIFYGPDPAPYTPFVPPLEVLDRIDLAKREQTAWARAREEAYEQLFTQRRIE